MSLQRLKLVDQHPWSIDFPCVRVKQPIGTFYLASIPHDIITDITFFDVRRILQDDRDLERYLGIQRPLLAKRVAALEQYVNHYDASFPTSIIICVDSRFAIFDKERRALTLSNCAAGEGSPSISMNELARVIDGQHRIAGLRNFQGNRFDVPVSILVGADISEQAQLFATVNLEQTKVSKSLAYDLYELAKTRSPQKTCHNIAVALNQDESSPFYNRIRRLGSATPNRIFEPISQATFVESLMQYVSSEPKADRDNLLRGKRLHRITGDILEKVPLRNLFVDEEDIAIAEIIDNYFVAIRERWPEAWNARGQGLILNRTNGFRGAMRAFRQIYLRLAAPGDAVSVIAFSRYFAGISARDDDFSTDNFSPGTAGEARIYRLFTKQERL